MEQMPPVMILCGGQGIRLREVTDALPKPMAMIGEQPMVWHIMRSYAAFGARRFILCLGYKREEFIDYFLNFHARSGDVTIRLGKERSIVYHDEAYEADWEVTLADTGFATMTGGRIRQAARHLAPEDREFFLTYGDGLSDIDIGELLRFHRKSGKALTVSAVHPEGRFGEMKLDGDLVGGFAEKPPRSPELNGHIEAFIGTFKTECLNQLVLRSEAQLRYVVHHFLEYYNHERPHTGLGGKMIKPHPQEPDGEIMEFSRLGGLLKSYRRIKRAVNE